MIAIAQEDLSRRVVEAAPLSLGRDQWSEAVHVLERRDAGPKYPLRWPLAFVVARRERIRVRRIDQRVQAGFLGVFWPFVSLAALRLNLADHFRNVLWIAEAARRFGMRIVVERRSRHLPQRGHFRFFPSLLVSSATLLGRACSYPSAIDFGTHDLVDDRRAIRTLINLQHRSLREARAARRPMREEEGSARGSKSQSQCSQWQTGSDHVNGPSAAVSVRSCSSREHSRPQVGQGKVSANRCTCPLAETAKNPPAIA